MLISLGIIVGCQLFINGFELSFPDKKRLIVTVACILLYLLISQLENKKNLVRNTVLLVVIFGCSVSILKPIQYGLDEESHLENTLEISEGGLFKYETVDIPDYNTVERFDSLRNPSYSGRFDWRKVTHKESNISGKIVGVANLAFVPSAIGWKLGSFVSNKVYVSYYLGRIFNVLVYALLLFIALKISKKYQLLIGYLGAFPAIIYICAGFHYDNLYFGTSLIIMALLTNYLDQEKSVGIKETVIFSLICLGFTFGKFPFILCNFLIALLPKKSYKQPVVRKVAFFASFIQIGLSGLYFISGSIINYLQNVNLAGSNVPGQVSLTYFLKNPLPIIRTMIDGISTTISSFTNPISYGSHSANAFTALMTIMFVFLFVIVASNIDIEVPNYFKIFIVIMCLGIMALVVYAISGDPRVYSPGDSMVGGVQGRYYYMIVALLPILFSKKIRILVNSQNELDDTKATLFLQKTIFYLNVLTMGIAMFIQVFPQ